jgi:hypothetical protein
MQRRTYGYAKQLRATGTRGLTCRTPGHAPARP